MNQSQWVEQPAAPDLFKGIVAGVVAGLSGAWAMNQYHALESKASDAFSGDRRSERGGGGGEPTTMKAADVVSQAVLNHPLTQHEKSHAGPMVHYGFGAIVGGIYGALAELAPAATMGAGTGYGAAVWLIADEVGVPLARLSPPPTQSPPSSHASAFAAHLVFGLTAETVRKYVREAME